MRLQGSGVVDKNAGGRNIIGVRFVLFLGVGLDAKIDQMFGLYREIQLCNIVWLQKL
jgi:hypothetical protein